MAEEEKTTADEDREEEALSHPWMEGLEEYPLREAEADPRWAVRTVWAWVWIGLLSLLFILVLVVLGFFYD
ncbi:MAG: hypothetical protein SCH98_06780 [Deferrisomatales bacterium]|nr:hypothetical protein [Deferrisomatales bacterium]